MVGQHLDGVHGRSGHGVELVARKVLQPEQQARQGRRIPGGEALVFVLLRQRDEPVQVGQADARAIGILLPLQDAACEPAAGDDEFHRLPRCQHRSLVAQAPQRLENDVWLLAVERSFLPPLRWLARCQPRQPVRQPAFRLSTVGKRHDFCCGQGVVVVVQASNAREREHRLGSGQQAGLLCRAGDSGILQSCRDGCHGVVGPSENGNVGGAHLAQLPGLRIHRLIVRCEQLADARRQGRISLLGVAAVQQPVRDGDGVVDLGTLRRQFHLARRNSLEPVGKDVVDELDQRRTRAPGVLEHLLRAAQLGQRLDHRPHQHRVAATKAINCLLDVPDPDDLACVLGQLEEQRELDRARVLKLVDHQ